MSEILITLLILGIAAGGVTVYVLKYKPLRKSKVKDLYAEGLDLLITGRRKSAYKNFKDIIQEDSDNIKAYLRLGQVLREGGNASQALKVHRGLLHRRDLMYYEQIELHKNLALDYYKIGNISDAIGELHTLLKIEKNSEWALSQLITFYREQQDWEKAGEYFAQYQKLTNKDDKHKLALYKIQEGRILIKNKKFKDARETFEKALNISSDGEQLILVSWVDNDVRIWDQKKQQRIWEKSGLNAPVSAIRYADQVVVAEHGSQRIVGFSQEGNLKTIFASNLPAPTGLLKDDKNLYVSDRTLGQIILVAVDGLPLAKKEVVIDGLTTPEGFVKKGDTFFIVEADLGVVTSVNLKGKRKVIAKISKGSQAASPMQPPSQVFNGITIDDKGALYVPGESDRALYKITNY